MCPGCGKGHGGQGKGQPDQPGGQGNGPGQGFGKRDIGDLNKPEKFKPSRVRGKVGKGKIVGAYFTRGAQVKGESKAEYQEVIRAAKAQAAEVIEHERIPKGYEKLVKDYIDSITPERQ